MVSISSRTSVRVLRCSYANSLLLPVALAKFRLWEPLLRMPPASGVEPVPGWLDRLLYAPLALEAALLRAGIDLPLGQSLVHVDVAGPARGRRLDEQLGRQARGGLREVRVDALLPAVRALGAQAQALGGAEDPGRLEVRSLQQDLGRGLADLGRLAAHDPGQGDGAVGVGDHQVVGLELPLDAIEGADRLARLGPPDDDPPAVQRRQVEWLRCP
jgi:hypothetical protein